MSLLVDPVRGPSDGVPAVGPTSPEPLRSPTLLAVLAALQAAALSLLCVVVPVMAAWTASPRTSATWPEALRIGVDAWLLAHHTGIAIEGGHLGLVPLGLAAVPAFACWAAGRRVATAVGGHLPLRALVALSATYALVAALLSLLAATAVARPVSAQALLGAGVLACVAATAGAGRVRRNAGGPRTLTAMANRLRLAVRARAVLRAAAVAVTAQVAAGALLLAGALAVQHERVSVLHRALDAGVAGGAVLTLGQLSMVPNLAVWSAAWLAGPGFSLGTGTSVTPAASILGPMPAVPLLGAVPAPGPMSWWAGLALLVPVLCGVLAGWWLHRRRRDACRRQRIVDAVSAAAAAGVALTVLAWLAGGPGGPGRLADLGPSPWLTGLAFAGEVATGALTVALLLRPATDRASRRS